MLLKSIYVMVYMMAINGISTYSAYQLLTDGMDPGWFGVLLANLPAAMFFNYVTMTKRMARTTRNMPMITIITSLGVLLLIVSWVMSPGAQELQLVLGVVGLLGWILYDFWYSSYGKRDTSQLEVGQMLPEFALKDLQGKTFPSSEFTGKPTLFLFYRGNWCPLCMAQIKEIAGQYRQIARRGAQIVLVSPQPHKHTRKLADKFDVPFIYMIDEDNKAARILNIAARNGLPVGMQAMGYESDTVMPTVVITDVDGKIIFADLTDNYRVRPEPETFIRALDAQLRPTLI